MSPLRNNHSLLCLVGILLVFASCQESFGIENVFDTLSLKVIGQNAFSPQEQDVLMEEIQNRHQISEANVYNDVLTISFSGGKTIHIRSDYFPLVQADDSNYWRINGKSTDLPIIFDDNKCIILPSLVPGDDQWLLDGSVTGISTESYRDFATNSSSTHLLGILAFQDMLHIYKSDGKVESLPIIKELFYRVPDYWMNHLIEKEKMAENAISEADGDCAYFVFFTDAHWGNNMRKSPALIRHIIDYTPIYDVLFGGDVITSHSSNRITPLETGLDFQESFSFLGTHFHCLYGNHDNNSDSQPAKIDLHLTEEQVYYWLQRQMTDVVYGNYYNFYYDNPANKTRIICLDTGRYYYAQFRDRLPETVRFAIQSLESVPEGWHIIMASHIWCTAQKRPDGTWKQYLDVYTKSILKVFDDYNAHLRGKYTYKKESIPYDFTGSKGHIEFCIGGHTHMENTTSSDGGIPIIITTSDVVKNPQVNTTQEQSVTIVVADYRNKKLNLFAVGRGEDRSIILK